MKMNVETKAVYEKYGVSMTGGCRTACYSASDPVCAVSGYLQYTGICKFCRVIFSDGIADQLLGTCSGDLAALATQLNEFGWQIR